MPDRPPVESKETVIDLADMRQKLRPPEPGSLAPTLADNDLKRTLDQIDNLRRIIFPNG